MTTAGESLVSGAPPFGEVEIPKCRTARSRALTYLCERMRRSATFLWASPPRPLAQRRDVRGCARCAPPGDYVELALRGGLHELALRLSERTRARPLDRKLEQLLTRDTAGVADKRAPAKPRRLRDLAQSSAGLVDARLGSNPPAAYSGRRDHQDRPRDHLHHPLPCLAAPSALSRGWKRTWGSQAW